MSWILGSKISASLRDPAPAAVPAPPPPAAATRAARRRAAASATAAARSGAAARRSAKRASAAAPRWRSAASVLPKAWRRSCALLDDADPEVRQMAAFALGLIGDRERPRSARRGTRRSVAARQGQRRRSARADRRRVAAAAIGARWRRSCRVRRARAGCRPTMPTCARDSPAARVPARRVRAGAPEGVRRARGAPCSTGPDSRACAGGRSPTRLQRLEDPRALPALLTLLREPHPYTRAFAAKGLGAMKDRAAVGGADPAGRGRRTDGRGRSVRSLGRLGDPAAAAAADQDRAVAEGADRTCGSKR